MNTQSTITAKYDVNTELDSLLEAHELELNDSIEILWAGGGFNANIHYSVKNNEGHVVARATYHFNRGPRSFNRTGRARVGGGRWDAYVSLVTQIKAALELTAA